MQPRMRSLSPFIDPATPVLVPEPPLGPEWLHEIKWDGYRMQVQRPAIACGCLTAVARTARTAIPA